MKSRKLVPIEHDLAGNENVPHFDFGASEPGHHGDMFPVQPRIELHHGEPLTAAVLPPAPYLVDVSPANHSTGVATDADIVLTFSQPIMAGTGAINIQDAHGTVILVSVTDTSQVSISGNTLTIDLTSDLPFLDGFIVQIPRGIVTSLSGEPSPSPYQIDFLTEPDPSDQTPPVLLSISPADDASLGNALTLHFNEPVIAGDGYIEIHSADGALVSRLAATDFSHVHVGSISEIVTIDWGVRLTPGMDYYVTIDPGAITDAVGNAFAGIASPTAWNFTTSQPVGPTLLDLELSSGPFSVLPSAGIILNFSEGVQQGNGSVRIYDATDKVVVETIDISDTSMVSISGSQVVIDPSADFLASKTYYVLVDAGALVDQFGHEFAAIVPRQAQFTVAKAPKAPIIYGAADSVDKDVSSISGFTGLTVQATASHDSSFINYANLSYHSDSANVNVTAIAANSDGLNAADFIINHGTIAVDAPQSQYAFGVGDNADGPKFTNAVDGQIIVRGDNAFGYSSYDASNAVTNAGLIDVTGRSAAIGVALHNLDWHVENSGSISVHGGNGLGDFAIFFGTVGLWFGTGELVNTGSITATADTNPEYAIGVLFEPEFQNAPPITIDNSGDISAPLAIVEFQDPNDPQIMGSTILNRGTIEGRIYLGNGDDTVTNTGTISGVVDLGGQSDTLNNSGIINDTVLLGTEDDVFNGTGGTVLGVIDGGAGDDLIYTGVSNPIIEGGAGTDTVFFSGPSSHYSISSDGPETIVSDGEHATRLRHVENVVFDDGVVRQLPSSGIIINVTYDDSANSAPAQFKAAVELAVQFLESTFSDQVTLNIKVGYGSVDGFALPDGALGASEASLLSYYNGFWFTRLSLDASSTNDMLAIANSPTHNWLGDSPLIMAQAEAKAIGLAPLGFIYTELPFDGAVAFSSTATFDFDPSNGVTAGSYDFFGTALHEITEIMGRMLGSGGGSTDGSPKHFLYDMFHYSAPGVLDVDAGAPSYFSIDGGITNLGDFNGISPGDIGDWASGANDSFNAFADPGVVNGLSAVDLMVMDVIGWDLAGLAHTFGGTTGADVFSGGAGDDVFNLGSGGNDNAHGVAGNDTFVLGAALTASDRINGGFGTDTLQLSGNYAAGVVFGPTTVLGVENLVLGAGSSYRLVTSDGTVAAETNLTILANALGPTDSVIFDGSQESNGRFVYFGGAGNDTVAGGAGNDLLVGGLGNDTVSFRGSLVGVSVSLAVAGPQATVDQGVDTIVGFENLIGSAANDTLRGNESDNVLTGQAGNDLLDITAGGVDTAVGGLGDDIVLAGGSLTALDRIDGGAGTDTIILHGDYAQGLVLDAATLTGIESITLTNGFSYALSLNDATVRAGADLILNASALSATDTFSLDASAEKNGRLTVLGGDGADTIITGTGDDAIYSHSGDDTIDLFKGGNDVVNAGDGADTILLLHGSLKSSDQIDGGGGNDTAVLSGKYGAGLTLSATTLTDLEQLVLKGGHNYALMADDGTVAAGQTLRVNASDLDASHSLTFDGSHENDGHFIFESGLGADHLTGGALADTFVYRSAAQSSGATYDTLTAFDFSLDRIDIAGSIIAIDEPLTHGRLSGSTFDTDLSAALASQLGAHHAILFTPDSGKFATQVFLVVDLDGVSGYQAGADLVLQLNGSTGQMTVADFI